MHDNLCCPASNCVFIVLIDAPPNNVCQWQKPRWFSHLWTKVPSFSPLHPFILYSMPYRCYFLSTLFHSLHYIICLIQTLCLFPQKIHPFITIPTKELSLPPFISFYESLRAILRLILSFSPFSHSFLPFSFFVFFSLLPIFSHFCPFSAPFIVIFSLLPVIFTKNTKSQSFLFAMHIYPWDGLVI